MFEYGANPNSPFRSVTPPEPPSRDELLGRYLDWAAGKQQVAPEDNWPGWSHPNEYNPTFPDRGPKRQPRAPDSRGGPGGPGIPPSPNPQPAPPPPPMPTPRHGDPSFTNYDFFGLGGVREPRDRADPRRSEPTKGYGIYDEPGFVGPPEPAPNYRDQGPYPQSPSPMPTPNPRPAPPPPPAPSPRGLGYLSSVWNGPVPGYQPFGFAERPPGPGPSPRPSPSPSPRPRPPIPFPDPLTPRQPERPAPYNWPPSPSPGDGEGRLRTGSLWPDFRGRTLGNLGGY